MIKFSYAEYKSIINYYLNELKITKLHKIKQKNKSFFFIRHDVEFSILRALQLAKFEKEHLQIKTNYFFHIKNNCYNLISHQNIGFVNQIQELGHSIGLHFNYSGIDKKENIKKELFNQFAILKKYFKNISIYFTPHRPSTIKSLQDCNIKGVVNLYSKKYFTEFNKIDDDYNKPVYLADSRGMWKYIHPMKLDLKKHKKVQLNFHPDIWSVKGFDTLKNYNELIKDNEVLFKKSLLSETDNLNKFIKI